MTAFSPSAACWLAVAWLAGAAPAGTAQTLADVPGRVVYWRESPWSRWVGPGRVYTTSPSIAVLPDGDYLIAFNLFGPGLSPAAADSGTTLLYRSSDQGASWSELPSSPLPDMKRGSLFVHAGDVYLWGYQSDSGPPRIMKSVDGGLTWSAPVQLAPDPRGGTPMNPVFHRNENGVVRLWLAVGGRRMMSARADRDLLDPANWSSVGGNAGLGDLPDFPSGMWDIISEAQIVASPQTGVVVLPKVQFKDTATPYFSRSILFRRQAQSNRDLVTAGPQEWVDLPGADKKFAAAHDPVSGRFYVLSNPVLPAHAGHHEPWNLIRNTAALLSSEDLVHWDVVRLFLYSPNVAYEAFQYLNFDFDGDDLVVASRTAFDLTGEPGVNHRPPRGHDSNLITFHRIPDFRTATPDHYLEIGDGVVRRHERTAHAPALLGNFVMGTEFEGEPLRAADGLAPGPDGGVLVRERGGRVLHFDRLGNFLGTAPAEDVPFQSRLDVAPPPAGERGWTPGGSGDWDHLHHWFYGNRPDTFREIAHFGSAIRSASTVTLHRARTVQGLRFNSPQPYTLRGRGLLVLGTPPHSPGPETPATALIEATRGSHRIEVPVRLESDTEITTRPGAAVLLSGGFDLAGRTALIGGGGAVTVGEGLSMNGGTLVLAGTQGLRLDGGGTHRLDGTLQWRPEENLTFRAGETFTLLRPAGTTQLQGSFDRVILPELPAGLRWDREYLYSKGTVSVAREPESVGPAAPGQPEFFRQLGEVVHRVVRYDKAEFSGWPANHGLWSWDDGREILVGFSCGPYVADKEGHKIGDPERDLLARSLDGGETWTMVDPAGYVSEDREPVPLTEPVDFTAPGFVLRVKMGGGDQPPCFYHSADKGNTWRGPFLFNGLDTMPELAGLATLTPRTDYIVGGSKECLIFLSGAKESWTDRTFAVSTADGGLSFSFVSWLTDANDSYRAVMPQTVRLGPGEYLTLLRRRALPPQDIECWIEARHSADGGRTWSHRARVAYTGFHNSNGSPPALLRLRDGRLLAAYANRSLDMILCRMSSDQGRTWGPEMIVRQNFKTGPGPHGFSDFGYPRLVERPDGRVAVIYYFSSKKRNRQHIACSIFSPDGPAGEVAILRQLKTAPLPADITGS